MLGSYRHSTDRSRAFLAAYLPLGRVESLTAAINAGEGLRESTTRPRRLADRSILDALLSPLVATSLWYKIDTDADRFMQTNHAQMVPAMRGEADRKAQRAEYMRKWRRGLVGGKGKTDANG